MNKSMLLAGLMTVLSPTLHAEATQSTDNAQTPPAQATSANPVNAPVQVPPNNPVTTPAQVTPTNPANTPAQVTPVNPAVPANTNAVPATVTTTTTVTSPATAATPQVPAPVTAPAVNKPGMGPATPAAPAQVTQPAVVIPPQPINCQYHIPAEVKQVDQSLVSQWAQKATVQSFDLSFKTIDTQIEALKNCYTPAGWQSFYDALQKSGNISAIKAQQLTVSAMVDGQAALVPVKDNQWKVSMPLQVVYQNDKEKLTQLLTVDVVIARKLSGDLGIIQMIARSQQSTPAAPATVKTTTSPAEATATPSPAVAPAAQ